MIFAPEQQARYAAFTSNLIWHFDNADLFKLEYCTDHLARAVQHTYTNLPSRNATVAQIEAFNAACAAYQEVCVKLY